MAVEIKALHVYWYAKKFWKSPQDPGPRNKLTIYPSGPAAIQIKLDIAEALKKISKKVFQYYVVAEVTKSDGTPGFRVIVPLQK